MQKLDFGAQLTITQPILMVLTSYFRIEIHEGRGVILYRKKILAKSKTERLGKPMVSEYLIKFNKNKKGI